MTSLASKKFNPLDSVQSGLPHIQDPGCSAGDARHRPYGRKRGAADLPFEMKAIGVSRIFAIRTAQTRRSRPAIRNESDRCEPHIQDPGCSAGDAWHRPYGP